MPTFAANLSFLYAEHEPLDRIAAAAADGFSAVELLFPYDLPTDELKLRLAASDVRLVLINAPPGDFQHGERGLACLPGREDEFRRGFAEQALPYARKLNCQRIHVMAGLMPAGADRNQLLDVYRANLAWAAAQCFGDGIAVLIEPINPRDMPGYLISRQAEAHQIAAEVGAENLKVQFDLYHAQIVEGDLTTKIRHYLSGDQIGSVGHFQIAGVPERHEPDGGEVAYDHLFALLDELGWDGYVGCEYHPRQAGPGGTTAGLEWLRRWRTGKPG